MTLEEQLRALLAEGLAGLTEAPPEPTPDEAEFPEIEVDAPPPAPRPAKKALGRPAGPARPAPVPPPAPPPEAPAVPPAPPRLFTPEMMEELEVSLRAAQRGLARVQDALAVMRQATGWPGSYQAPVLRRPGSPPRPVPAAVVSSDRPIPALPAAQIFGPPGSRWSTAPSVLPSDLITEEGPPISYQGEE